MCGPSKQQEQIAGQQASFAGTLQSNYATQFGAQSAILSSLNNAMSPIVAAGPNQQGYSAQELSALNAHAINTAGGAYKNAAQAVSGQLAGRGGDSGLTSGVDAQIKGSLASSAAGNASNALNTIATQNYDVGRQNFFNAASGQRALAGLYDPTGYAGQGTGASNAAFGDATKVQDEKNQEESEIAGGIASIGMDAATFGVGAAGGGGFVGGLKGLTGQG